MKYLTTKQVAERLQVSAKIVYQLCAVRGIAHARVGSNGDAVRKTEAAPQESLEGCGVPLYGVPSASKHIKAWPSPAIGLLKR